MVIYSLLSILMAVFLGIYTLYSMHDRLYTIQDDGSASFLKSDSHSSLTELESYSTHPTWIMGLLSYFSAPLLAKKSLSQFNRDVALLTEDKDIALTVEQVYSKLFQLFGRSRLDWTTTTKEIYPEVPLLTDNNEALIMSLQDLVLRGVKTMEDHYRSSIMELKSELLRARIKQKHQDATQKAYETEIRKDVNSMLAMKDSTIFSLRLSLRNKSQELERALKSHRQSLQGSANTVRILNNKIAIQAKTKKQIAVDYSSNVTYLFRVLMKSLEYHPYYGIPGKIHPNFLWRLPNPYFLKPEDLPIKIHTLQQNLLAITIGQEDERSEDFQGAALKLR